MATDAVGGVVVGISVAGAEESGDDGVGDGGGCSGGHGVLIGRFVEGGVAVENDDERGMSGELGAGVDSGFGAVAGGSDPLGAALRGGSDGGECEK